MQKRGQHTYLDPAAYDHLSRQRSSSPHRGMSARMGDRAGAGSLSQAACNTTAAPAGYALKYAGYRAATSLSSGSGNRAPSPQQQQRMLDALAAKKGIYSPILEEQATITETCSWSGSMDAARNAGYAAPERMVCSTPVSPCVSPDPGSAHHNDSHWLRNVFRLAASKALKKPKRGDSPPPQELQHRAAQHTYQQHQQHQYQQQQYQQQQQMAAPGRLQDSSWTACQQQQQQQSGAWWKAKTPRQGSSPLSSRSVSPVNLGGGGGGRPGSISPLDQSPPRRQYIWSPQASPPQQQQQQHLGGYPQPVYDERQQLMQQQMQLQVQTPQQVQPRRPTQRYTLQAEAECQEEADGSGSAEGQDAGDARSTLAAPCEEEQEAADGCSSNSEMPQVVNVNSGQVLKVTPSEFQDILTVMQALADARKTLAVKLNVTCDSLDSQPNIVSAAAAKMAATAAAAAAAPSAPANSDGQRTGVQRQQPGPSGSNNNERQTQQQEQQEQEGYAPASDSTYPTAAEGEEATALEDEENPEEDYRVYSCTVQGLAAAAANSSSGSSYPLSGGPQAAAPSAAAAGGARWQPQQQTLWMHPPAPASKAGRRGSLADCGIRNPSQLINTSLTGEQPASAVDLAAGDSMPAYPTDTLEGLATPASLSGGRRQSQLQQQQEPDTPHSLVVHAPASVNGALLTGSSPGATPPRSTNASALNTTESCLQQDNMPPDQQQQEGNASGHRLPTGIARGAKSVPHGSSGGGAYNTRHSHCSNPDSLVSSELSERQLELHRTGWTDDDNMPLGQLRAQFNQGEPCSPDATPRAARRSSQAAQWDEVLERQASPKPESEQTQMKHLYKKVAELESGLLKLLSGSLITPAAAAALIASLNKIAASGVVKSLSSGGGAPDGTNNTDNNNRLVETIQKAALAAAAASSNGGAPPFAVALGRLANSMGGKKSLNGGTGGSSSTRHTSTRSGSSSLNGLMAGRRTDCQVPSHTEGQSAAADGRQDMSKQTASVHTQQAPQAASPGMAEEEHCRAERTPHQAQEVSQQPQQQQLPSSITQVNSGVAMAMEVLAKAEERLKELHIQEERLKAFWATRNSAAAPLGRRSTSRKSSGQPETIQEVEPEQEQEQDARAAAGGESRPLLSGPNSAAASRAASSSGRHGLSVLQHHQQQQQQRKPSMDGTAGLSRRVSFNEDHRLSMGSASGRGHESAGGKSYPSVLLSPRSTEESCARGAGGPSSNVHGTMEPSAGGADSDGFSGCWSDDSADPGSRMRRLLSQQRRSRMQLKQQRSVGGMGAGYESADEGLGSSTGGGAYSECVDEEFEEPGGYTLHHLAATDSSRSGLSPGDRSYINRLSHSALHSAPVSASLSSASSRRHLLLSLADPRYDSSLDDVTAKAVAKVRRTLAAAKPARPFKARDVPAHVYESRYASLVNGRPAGHSSRLQAADAASRPGSYVRGLAGAGSGRSHGARGSGSSYSHSSTYGSAAPTTRSMIRVPGAATAAQMLATSTRSGAGAFSSRSTSAATRLSADRSSSSRRSQGALGALDTVLERQVLRSNPTALLPAALKRAYSPYRTSSPSSAARKTPTAAAAAAADSVSATARAYSSREKTGGYSTQPRRSGKPAAAGGGYGTHIAASTGTGATVSRRCRAADSVAEAEESLEYLTNLLTLKRACPATDREPPRSYCSSGARQLQQAYRSPTPAYSNAPSAARPSSRQPRDRRDRSPSPAGRDSYSLSYASREHLPHLSSSRPASVGDYSSGGGAAEQMLRGSYSRGARSGSTDRLRRSEQRPEHSKQAAEHARLQQQRRSVDAGSSYAASSRHSADSGGYASRRSTIDAAAAVSGSSSWKVQAAAAELERRIAQYRAGRASPLGRASLY